MLIRFTVKNFLSFNDEVEFSMIAGRTRKHSHHVIRGQSRNDLNLLKAGVIYGANASGKSNLIRAMAFAKKLIINGTRPNKLIPLNHFKLDESCADKPTKFEFEFKSQGASYAYGFELSPRKIHTEWLYKIRKTDQTLIFERETTDSGEAIVQLGKIDFKDEADKQRVELTRIGTRHNQLFLTQSIENRVAQFDDVISWFRRLSLIFPDTQYLGLEVSIDKNDEFSSALVEFLQLFNIDISGLGFEKIDDFYNDVADLPTELKDELVENLEPNIKSVIQLPHNNSYLIYRNEENDIEAFKLKTKHLIRATNEETSFEMREESDGTLRLIELIPALIGGINNNRVYIIDELDRSFHPKLSYKFIESFLNHKKENLSQLIVTTHESSLLDLELLRRDEIWFVEKDKDGASSIYSLEEFKPGYDKDLRKGYLLGRFGAIPIVPRISDLGW